MTQDGSNQAQAFYRADVFDCVQPTTHRDAKSQGYRQHDIFHVQAVSIGISSDGILLRQCQ